MSGKKAKLLRKAERALGLSADKAAELRRAHDGAPAAERAAIGNALRRFVRDARALTSPLALPRPAGRLIATPAEAARERAGGPSGLIQVPR